jgi:opacity protein-like surface antigen
MRRLALLLTVVLIGAEAWAQQTVTRTDRRVTTFNRGRQTTLGGGLEIGIPVGAFSDSWGREIVGLSANIGVPMRLLPIDWGFDFAWGRMGGERDNVNLINPSTPNQTGSLAVNCNVYSYHGLLRFKPFNGQVSPYGEVLAGFRHFTTRTELRASGQSEPLEKDRRASDIAGSTGWAVGVQVAPGNGMFYLEGRFERINSGKVSYVDPSSIVIASSGDVVFNTLSSPTRTANVHLGIGFRF